MLVSNPFCLLCGGQMLAFVNAKSSLRRTKLLQILEFIMRDVTFDACKSSGLESVVEVIPLVIDQQEGREPDVLSNMAKFWNL